MRIAIWIAALLALVAAILWQVPIWADGAMNPVAPHAPYEIPEDARDLHETLFVADLHADSLLWNRDLLRRNDRGHLDLPRMEEG
ncbi:MAG TPA: peptidase M19, partial [Sphingomonadales bacterium]